MQKFKKTSNKETDRYYQWNILQEVVNKNLNNNYNIEELSVNLGMFLSSWGMYRGSSMLLKHFNHRIHNKVIEEIFKDKRYFNLINIKNLDTLEKNIDLIGELYELISNTYRDQFNDFIKRSNNKSIKSFDTQKTVSRTLVTKVMIGLFGCIIAYDTYAIKTIKELNNNYGNKIIVNIHDKDSVVKSLSSIFKTMKEIGYIKSINDKPLMKEYDMALFQWGYDKRIS